MMDMVNEHMNFRRQDLNCNISNQHQASVLKTHHIDVLFKKKDVMEMSFLKEMKCPLGNKYPGIYVSNLRRLGK